MRGQSPRGAVRLKAASFLSIFALLFSLVVGVFVHTDDGCAIERHCQTCAFALHHADGTPSPVKVAAGFRLTELATALPSETIARETEIHASRGPPPARSVSV